MTTLPRPAATSVFALLGQANPAWGRGAFARLLVAATRRRFPLVVLTHLVFIAAASFLAVWLRFDGRIPTNVRVAYVQILPWLLAIRLLTFLPFGLYNGLWRYTSVWDLSRIVLAVLVSSGAAYGLLYQGLDPALYPRSIIVFDSLLLISFLGGVRLLWRIVPDAVREKTGRRILIIGAGDAGEMIVREMRKGAGYEPVGFVDQDPGKVGRTIHGVTVLGTLEDLPRLVASASPSEALVAIPSADAAAVRDIVRHLEPFKLRITTLPSLREIVNGRVGVSHIRPLAIQDLLPRSPVSLNVNDTRRLIKGKRVLVTGAGGSIGAELCRQIATFDPAALVLFERYENSLYDITNDLADRGVSASVHSVIGDITDAVRVESVFADHRPQIIFHAAAHKHVPLMEANICEAVKNNVVGTSIVAEAAGRHHAERFVLISTDKAINPTSVMGASKRVAELLLQALGSRGWQTRFVTVRFGNVLGSNGSVIPRMVDQIRAGGPVTVTHPEIRRYFMLIPEAVQLVLQAAVLAREQETFVLEMGEPVKMIDVARNLIRLSGFVPDEEIPISFIGLRPGEKLFEELVGEGETLEPAGPEKVLRVRGPAPDIAALEGQVTGLARAAAMGDTTETRARLRRLVPTFVNASAPAIDEEPHAQVSGAPTSAAPTAPGRRSAAPSIAAVSAAPHA